MPVNVARIITWLPVGGIERRLAAIAPLLQRSGRFNVRVCCIRERGPLADALEDAGVAVDVIPFRRRWDLSGLAQLRDYLRRHRIDVVHSHMYRSNVPATVAARLAGAPVMVAQIHNMDTWETRRQLRMDRFLCRWRDAVVAVSEAVRRDVIDHLVLPEEKVRLLYNGIDVDTFARPDPEARQRLRAQWGVGENAVVALMSARLHPQKNPLGLLRAFDAMADQVPLLHLVYAGKGPLKAELEAEIEKRGRQERVRLIGMRSDMPDVLAAADFTVLPSFKEGFSNMVLESMAASRPCLCADVGGNREVVVTGKNGIVVPPGDEVALARGLKRLGLDRTLREVFGLEAHLQVQRFSLAAMADATMDLYDDLLKRKGRMP